MKREFFQLKDKKRGRDIPNSGIMLQVSLLSFLYSDFSVVKKGYFLVLSGVRLFSVVESVLLGCKSSFFIL